VVRPASRAPGPRIPQVVVFLLGGVIIGPHVLGVAEVSSIHPSAGQYRARLPVPAGWLRT